MTILLILMGFFIDLALALMTGTTFYFMWGWLIVPTLEIAALSWISAVMIVFVAKFVTQETNNDIFDIALDDAWLYVGKLMWATTVRCLSFGILAYMLSFII